MKTLSLGAILLCCFASVTARADVGLDDTYDHVIAEKGQPIGHVSAGDSVILRYSDGSIRLKAGRVVAINLKPAGEPTSDSHAVKTPVKWGTDYRAALAEAQDQHRHLFVFFTGSDWCGWCKRLQREILTTPEFSKYAAENLVLLEVDFPRGKTQSAALKKQNQTLQRLFEIKGYPTVIVLDADGKAVGRLGYREGGPGPFVSALKAL